MALNKNSIGGIALLVSIIAIGMWAYFLWEIPQKHTDSCEKIISPTTETSVQPIAGLPIQTSEPAVLTLINPTIETQPHITNQPGQEPPKKVKLKPRRRYFRKHKKTVAEREQTAELVVLETTQPVVSTVMQPVLQEASKLADQLPVETSIITNTLTIINDIPLESLAVKHWSGTYTPTKLVITINDTPFTIIGENPTARGTRKDVARTGEQLTVTYMYEFMNGMRTGADTVRYTVQGTAAPLTMRFSWGTPWHVEFDHAQPIKTGAEATP